MYQRSAISPVPHSFLHEVLVECFDALMYPFDWTGGRDDHIKVINECMAGAKLPDSLYPLFEQVLEQFQNGPTHPLENGTEKPSRDLAFELAGWMDKAGLPRYVYHGTIYGRLKDIKKEGLVPGAKPVWKDRFVSREHCDGAVFFELTWRGAWNWASAAHQSSRGRRDGKHRMPVVVRTPMTGLRLELDPQASSPYSCMVRSAVVLDEASVIVVKNPCYPEWKPLADVVSE